jgi:carboxypeptidase Q
MKKLPLVFAFTCVLAAQDKVDEATSARIRSEELEHSMIMHTEHMLTDRFGPRMTGTPNHEAAVDWVIKETTAWGMKNAHKEAWDFGHPGWLNERASGFITAPVKENLKFEVLAWTPSTEGTVTGSAIQLIPPRGPEAPAPANAAAGGGGFGGRGGPQFLGPTQAQMDQWIAQVKSSVRGKMVLIGKAAVIPVDFNPPQKRLPDDPAAGGRGRGNFGGGGRGPAVNDGRLTARQVTDAIDTMLLASGALVRINDAARGQGIIVAQQNPNYAPEKTVPTVILRNDDYGRIERLLDDKDDVKLEFNIENKIFPEGKTSYDVVAEIPGSDKKDEIVMLGGHLDSWHAATGATDNGIGSSIMLEAARLIQTLGLKPRRTIRVALWSGEEEGLLGSLAYVKAHFGTFENPKPEFAKLDCYFNVDTGTGRLRGAGIFGPPEAATILEPVFALFKDWGFGPVTTTTSRATGGTDSTSYNNAGLPGIGFRQDPIEYGSMTHHTNLDTYERIIPDDVKEASAEVAAAVWFVANRDQMMPRFNKETMPAPVAAR